MGEFESKSRINALGGDSMVELYVVMIQRGLIKGATLEEQLQNIPVRYREDVRALLEAVE